MAFIVRWHKSGFALYWQAISRARRIVGRRRISKEFRDLIFRMVAENPTWGAPRIHGEFLTLGFAVLRVVGEGRGFPEAAYDECRRGAGSLPPGAKWRLSCAGAIGLCLWMATPYAVESQVDRILARQNYSPQGSRRELRNS